jgi:hypothetical protein
MTAFYEYCAVQIEFGRAVLYSETALDVALFLALAAMAGMLIK